VETPPAPLEIIALGVPDAGELLTLQRAAYVVEAQAHDDPRLPPLTETLAEIRAALAAADVTVLGVRDRARLIATVRLQHDPADPSIARVARLAVAPDRQGEGLGSRLLAEVERHTRPGVRSLILFTGERSHANLGLYSRRGYSETHRSDAGNHELVHMRKPLG
jgi:GNAT superfamily N-acetyltransferase